MLTIAWDIDDVLNALMREWFNSFWRPAHPDCRLAYEEIKMNPPAPLLGVPLEEYLQSLDAFRLSGDYERMLPNPKILTWFNRYGSSYRHMALTAVPRIAAAASAAWMIKYFGDWIRTFHFVPSARAGDIPTGYESTKIECLGRLQGIDLFIDDHPGHVQAAASLGIRSFLVSRPWNSEGMETTEILAELTAIGRHGSGT